MTLQYQQDLAPNASYEPPFIVAESEAMRKVLLSAQRAAQSSAKVLITGESGVGKDLVARYVHANSPRSRQRFIAVNCAGLPEELLETELFGHVKGSFTGAYRDTPGKLQLADRGTLFLDEVAEMSLRMQALLLRFLENGEIQRVGAADPNVNVDVRIIAATNGDLPGLVAAGKFREDLIYRLRVIHLQIPPLRARRDDIRAMAEHFSRSGQRQVRISAEALRLLERYRWPGNARELYNVMEQAAWSTLGNTIEPDDLPTTLRSEKALLYQTERRRRVADDLYQALVGRHCSFWEHVHPLFINRDLTRHDIRELMGRGLTATRGNYRALLTLFGMPPSDYKRMLNFLSSHGFNIDFRAFRTAAIEKTSPPQRAQSPLDRVLPRRGDWGARAG
jgi:transcriptional regulator with PAS, ATPase and Fis domain